MAILNPQQFLKLSEQFPFGLIVVDHEAKLLFINREAERLFGYSHDALLGQSMDCLLPNDVRNKHSRYLTRFFESPTARPLGEKLELQGLHRNGSRLWLDIALTPIRLAEQQGVLGLAVFWDVSARVNSDKERAAAQTNTERANKAAQILSARFSHELRTPLNAILGFTHIALSDTREPLGVTQRGYLAQIDEAAQQLLDIANELRELSCSVEDSKSPVLMAIPPLTLLREAMQSVEKSAREKAVTLELIGPELPSIRVQADPVQSNRILRSLLCDAIGRCCSGEKVCVEYQHPEPPDSCFKLRIHNSSDISPRRKNVDKKQDTREGSTPRSLMKLSVCQRLINVMGGDMGLESNTYGSHSVWVEFTLVT